MPSDTLSSAWLGGCLLGLLGLALTRWEHTPRALHYTPNRWLILIITLVVSARLLYGIWRIWHGWWDCRIRYVVAGNGGCRRFPGTRSLDAWILYRLLSRRLVATSTARQDLAADELAVDQTIPLLTLPRRK